jgi:hypothetical protein
VVATEGFLAGAEFFAAQVVADGIEALHSGRGGEEGFVAACPGVEPGVFRVVGIGGGDFRWRAMRCAPFPRR